MASTAPPLSTTDRVVPSTKLAKDVLRELKEMTKDSVRVPRLPVSEKTSHVVSTRLEEAIRSMHVPPGTGDLANRGGDADNETPGDRRRRVAEILEKARRRLNPGGLKPSDPSRGLHPSEKQINSFTGPGQKILHPFPPRPHDRSTPATRPQPPLGQQSDQQQQPPPPQQQGETEEAKKRRELLDHLKSTRPEITQQDYDHLTKLRLEYAQKVIKSLKNDVSSVCFVGQLATGAPIGKHGALREVRNFLFTLMVSGSGCMDFNIRRAESLEWDTGSDDFRDTLNEALRGSKKLGRVCYNRPQVKVFLRPLLSVPDSELANWSRGYSDTRTYYYLPSVVGELSPDLNFIQRIGESMVLVPIRDYLSKRAFPAFCTITAAEHHIMDVVAGTLTKENIQIAFSVWIRHLNDVVKCRGGYPAEEFPPPRIRAPEPPQQQQQQQHAPVSMNAAAVGAAAPPPPPPAQPPSSQPPLHTDEDTDPDSTRANEPFLRPDQNPPTFVVNELAAALNEASVIPPSLPPPPPSPEVEREQQEKRPSNKIDETVSGIQNEYATINLDGDEATTTQSQLALHAKCLNNLRDALVTSRRNVEEWVREKGFDEMPSSFKPATVTNSYHNASDNSTRGERGSILNDNHQIEPVRPQYQ